MIKRYFNLVKADYRHLICFIVTIISLGLGCLFPNSLIRLVEVLRDFLTSFVYYLLHIMAIDIEIPATVIRPQEWKIFEEIWEPVIVLPRTFEEFTVFWVEYWKIFIDPYNLAEYLLTLSRSLYNFSQIINVLLPLALSLYLYFDDYKNVHCNERGKKSNQLIKFQELQFKYLYPAIQWIKDFISFIKESGYATVWLITWAINLNVISILLAFISYYLYFVSSWDMLSIYTQLIKLQADLTPMIRFIPGIVWLIVGIAIYNYICRSMAFKKLYYAERCNRAVMSQRGVVTIVSGEMGKGKTQLITSMALTAQAKIYDDMYDVMSKYERIFPNFEWQQFRDELKYRIKHRKIVDLASCRENVIRMSKWFDYIVSHFTAEKYRDILSRYPGLPNRTFGYDYDHFRATYNDELKILRLFKALEEYACAYYVFIIETTLIFSNYSIREDSMLGDFGNMEFRDNDFFKRDPELQDMYSRYAHIIDWDMIRLQRKMIENNDYGRVLHPGVYVGSEIDKERKNMLELKEIKINVDETNQKNDGFNPSLMMSRHANVVDYIPIIYALFDLQRAEGWGAGGRELGEVINIAEKGDLSPVLPFFSPYWFTQGVFEWIKDYWDGFMRELKEYRCDKTLFVYIVDNVITAINDHYDRINNLFGMQTLTLEIQSGKLDGKTKLDYWRLMPKKDRSERYRTDCLKSIFISDPPNEKHIDDFVMYEGILATPEELAKQNSYFQNDIRKMKGNN